MANSWTKFEDLLSSGRRSIAIVQSTETTSTRVVVILVGQTDPIYVESNGSEYADGSYVFLEGRIITGQAPNIRSSTPFYLS